MKIFAKLLSYLLPISIYRQKSAVNEEIVVQLFNGRLMIDTPNTNYSYGSLQRILRLGLKKIGFAHIQKMQHILVLGLAGGSVVKTLIDQVGYTGKITGVDIDNEIIKIANKYFQLDRIHNLEIIISDAEKFVKMTKFTYDLIIIDIFQDNEMPNFLFGKEFVTKTMSLLNDNGIVLFNTMTTTENHHRRNIKFVEQYRQMYFIQTISRVEKYNELIFIFKNRNSYN